MKEIPSQYNYPDVDTTKVSKRLIQLRKKANLSQCTLAKELGLAKSSINKYEHETLLSTAALLEYANYFHVPLCYILFGNEIHEKSEIQNSKPNIASKENYKGTFEKKQSYDIEFDYRKFGDFLKSKRETDSKKGAVMSCHELSRKMNAHIEKKGIWLHAREEITGKKIQSYEKGETKMPIDVLAVYMSYFNMSFEEMYSKGKIDL